MKLDMTSKNRIYFIGIGWFLLSIVSSVVNDTISKYTGMRMHSFQVAFFRFAFGALTLIPFIAYYGTEKLRSSRPIVHITRGVLLFLGMTAWTYGLTIAPVTTATVMSFSIPLFVLVLAIFFLNENIIWQRWLVTIVGFVGVVITLGPQSDDFNPHVLIFVLAAIAFSTLDIINKKFVIQESMISMLFYSAIVTAILAIPPAIYYWTTPTMNELMLLFVLGASSNVILFFILKAFSLVDATAVAPYRYLELIISSTAGYLLFDEVPTANLWIGAVILISSTLFIIYSENKKR